jgi:hypothetical protein
MATTLLRDDAEIRPARPRGLDLPFFDDLGGFPLPAEVKTPADLVAVLDDAADAVLFIARIAGCGDHASPRAEAAGLAGTGVGHVLRAVSHCLTTGEWPAFEDQTDEDTPQLWMRAIVDVIGADDPENVSSALCYLRGLVVYYEQRLEARRAAEVPA